MGKRARVRRQSLTSTQVRQQQQGSMRLGPGAWVDREGALHFSVPEILAHLHLPDTPEGRAEAMDMIEGLLREMVPSTTTIVRQDDEMPDG
jgi:hypothetical protein